MQQMDASIDDIDLQVPPLASEILEPELEPNQVQYDRGTNANEYLINQNYRKDNSPLSQQTYYIQEHVCLYLDSISQSSEPNSEVFRHV